MSEGSAAVKLEDLKTWLQARILAGIVYEVSRTGALARDHGLSTQMQRAAVSVAGNIAEGWGRGRPNELHQFLAIATGSCAELRSPCFIALDAGLLDQAAFDRIYLQIDQTLRTISGLRDWNQRRRT